MRYPPVQLRGTWLLSLILFVLLSSSMTVAADEAIDREFEFASGLVEMGFPDFAEKVVNAVILKNPNVKDRAKLVEAQILISRRKFDDALAILKAMPAESPKAQAINLALAQGYYGVGEVDKAKPIYQKFFAQYKDRGPTDPDLLRFYQESAYQFGMMLEEAGDYEGAAKAYERVLKTRPDENLVRRLKTDQAELYLRAAEKAEGKNRDKLLDRAWELCEEVQWGGMDAWFGRTIATMAKIKLLKGDKDGAKEVLNANMDLLKPIDKALKERGAEKESPMAPARFMLGELYEQEGNTVGNLSKALIEYYNVFAKYGDSDWGPEAGIRAQKLKERLEAMGKTVNIDLGKYKGKAAATQFKVADQLFQDGKYAEARNEYIDILNQYPEVENSPGAVGNLAICYANLDDTLGVKMVCDYLGERFPESDKAALAILSVGKHYFDADNADMYLFAYETYLEHYPEDDRAPAIIYTLAGIKKKAGDEAAAMEYYKRIIDNYPDDQYYLKALSRMGWDAYAQKNFKDAIPGLTMFVEEAQPGYEKAQAQFFIADSHKQLEEYAKAMAAYAQVVKWLKSSDSPYNTSLEVAEKNKDLFEKAFFFLGYTCARIQEPKDKVSAFRRKGEQVFQQFLTLFPKSELAPKAMNGLGTIQLEQGKFDAAVATFNDLAEKYPQSEEGENALFSLIRAAAEVGKYDVARQSLADMKQRSSSYTPDEFNRVGQILLDAGQYNEAIGAFSEIPGRSEERVHLERALYGMGVANYELKQYEKAIKSLNDLMTRYPKSGLFFNAKFMLGSAYRKAGQPGEAQRALSDVFKYADDPVLINEANLLLGKIQEEQGEQESALGSYQRVALLADPANPELRPLIEKSILASIDLSMKMGRYADAQVSCDQYMEIFPDGESLGQVRDLKAQAKLKESESQPMGAATGF